MYTTERCKNVLLKSGVIQKYTDESKVAKLMKKITEKRVRTRILLIVFGTHHFIVIDFTDGPKINIYSHYRWSFCAIYGVQTNWS